MAIYFKSINDILGLFNVFQVQIHIESFDDQLDFTETWQVSPTDFSLEDILYFRQEYIVADRKIHFSDTINLTQSFKRIFHSVFTDIIYLTENWGQYGPYFYVNDVIPISDNFILDYGSTWGDSLLFFDDVHLQYDLGHVIVDNIKLISTFIYYSAPEGQSGGVVLNGSGDSGVKPLC